MYLAILVIMIAVTLIIVVSPGIVSGFGAKNSMSTSTITQTSVSNASQIVTLNYELKWQNEPGAPFSCTNCTTAYQFIDIELEVVSYNDFEVGTPVQLFAYGTMSESLNYSGLQYVRLAYDNSTPYDNSNGVFQVPYGLNLLVVPNNTNTGEPTTYSVGFFVKLISEPVNVTWQSSGGPFYPRIDLHYYRGTEFNYKFPSAPVQIKTEAVATTARQSVFPMYEAGATWVVGIGSIIALDLGNRKCR